MTLFPALFYYIIICAREKSECIILHDFVIFCQFFPFFFVLFFFLYGLLILQTDNITYCIPGYCFWQDIVHNYKSFPVFPEQKIPKRRPCSPTPLRDFSAVSVQQFLYIFFICFQVNFENRHTVVCSELIGIFRRNCRLLQLKMLGRQYI